MRSVLLPLTLALAGCGSASEMQSKKTESFATMDVAEAPPPSEAPPEVSPGSADAAAPQPLKVAVPQMAYSYGYTFRLPESAIAAAQARHMAQCDALGPARCQVLAMQSSGGTDAGTDASLKLRVASAIARRFGEQLTRSVAAAGGRAVSSTIAAEDVSKEIVDTEARLRQRELLVARLTEILRTRQGKVAELVEAERSVAAAQEEIDQAKGWLGALRARVAMSTVEVRYQPVAPGPAAARGGLADSVSQSASVFVAGLSGLLQLAIFILPWALLGVAGIWVFRRVRPRFRRGADDTPPPE